MQYEFNSEDWESIDDDAVDLISKMLMPMETRLNAAEALQHPWILKA